MIEDQNDGSRIHLFETATTGYGLLSSFHVIKKLLAGDEGTELPLDAADPCPDFLPILHPIDL